MLVTLNLTTKKAQYYINRYITAHKTHRINLDDYYNTYSKTKLWAYRQLFTKFEQLWLNAHPSPNYAKFRPIVTGANCDRFTVMYIAPHPASHFYCLFIETAKTTYTIQLENVQLATRNATLYNFVFNGGTI